uniref:[RNA-polymerase]-subunit kinase n=1 Tax=Arundo donax TaxID=35708 RepID=A0A0A9GSE4_ARUDO
MAAAAVTRKRPAPDDDTCSAAAGKKRSRYQFGAIYDYQKLEVLGDSTYGVVVKARHRRTGETVAVKWIRGGVGVGGAPDLRAVVREAGCLAACRGHPSIVQIRDVAADEATGDLFLVMEFVGPSLRSRLTRPFSEAATQAFMRQLLRGAERIHGTGTIHRDIKTENVLVGPSGALKICDFGMATPVRPPYEEQCVGTLWYRSPEQLMGSRCYGPAVDMWALGCVMAELLAGEPLFVEVDTEEDMLMEVFHLRHEIESVGVQACKGLPELSQAGGEVLCGLLCFDEDERLTAADALRHRWFTEGAESPAVAETEHPGSTAASSSSS